MKKGPWSPDEDAKLKSYIEHHGTGGNWIALPHKIGELLASACLLARSLVMRVNVFALFAASNRA